MEAQNSIVINDIENLETISAKIKSNGITNIIIGENLHALPIFEGLQLIESLEIRSKRIKSIPSEVFINNQKIKYVILSTSVIKIAEKAFSNSSISRINLDFVREIESNAFCNCNKLNQVNLSNIKLLTSSCFKGTSLVEIDFPNQITVIPSYAFCNCLRLQYLTCNCYYIEHYAFCNCSSIKLFKFNDEILFEIAETAFLNAVIKELEINTRFYYYSFLKHIKISKIKIISGSGGNIDQIKAIFPNLKAIEFPFDWEHISLSDSQIEELITPNDPNYRCSIYLTSCYKLKSLPNNIKRIDYVGDMPELETVNLSVCTYISRNSFFNCPKLERIIGWGDHEMELCSCLFELCPLIDIKIWNNQLVFTLEENRYRQLYWPLENTYIKEMTIQSGDLPKFRGCKVLKKVTFLEDCGITKIDDYAFYDCESLTEVVLCASINSIGAMAFKNTNLSYFDFTNIMNLSLSAFSMTKLKKIIINNNILMDNDNSANQDENDICYLQNVASVILTSNVSKFIPAYFNNPNLKEYILDNNSHFISINKVIYTSNKETLYAYPAGLETKVFTVPDFVKTINIYSLSYCYHLETIIVGSNVKLSDGMFQYCTSVKSIEFKAATNFFPQYCFAFCSNLTSIILPESSVISELYAHCFHGCLNLQKFDFNNRLVTVDNSCFEKCISLQDVDLSQLNKIPENCFKLCGQGQINLHLSDNLRSISNGAFEYSSIQEFICPKNLIFIGEGAFANCTKLHIFKFNHKIFEIGPRSFYNVSIIELLIPDSLRIINPSCFSNSNNIQFKFSESGHPTFFIENDCFMNKSGGLIFII